MELKIEDLKYRDILVHEETGVEYEVMGFDSNGKEIIFSSGEVANDLKYFKKKEQSQYTFDDLIDVTVQAVKDGVIRSATIRNCEIGFMDGNTHYKLMPAFDCEEQINIVKSLYKETFVIEVQEDLKRIKDDAQITMTNGEILDYKDALSLESYINSFIFKLLKGATVEQQK